MIRKMRPEPVGVDSFFARFFLHADAGVGGLGAQIKLPWVHVFLSGFIPGIGNLMEQISPVIADHKIVFQAVCGIIAHMQVRQKAACRCFLIQFALDDSPRGNKQRIDLLSPLIQGQRLLHLIHQQTVFRLRRNHLQHLSGNPALHRRPLLMVPGADPNPSVPDFHHRERLTLAVQRAQDPAVRIRLSVNPLMGCIADIDDRGRRRHFPPDFRVAVIPSRHDIPGDLQLLHRSFSVSDLKREFLRTGRVHLSVDHHPIPSFRKRMLCGQAAVENLIHPSPLDLAAGLQDEGIRFIIKLGSQLIRIKQFELEEPFPRFFGIYRRVAGQGKQNRLQGGIEADPSLRGIFPAAGSGQRSVNRIFLQGHALFIPSEPVPDDLAFSFRDFLLQNPVERGFIPDLQAA